MRASLTSTSTLHFQIAELSGYTSRVSEMFAVFEDLQKGHYIRQVNPIEQKRRDSIDKAEEAVVTGPVGHGEVVDVNQLPGGEVVDTEGAIVLQDVAIITPCGDVIVSSLSFEV